MSREDLLACGAMGFILGLFVFAAAMIRVRRWPFRSSSSGVGIEEERYGKGTPVQPTTISLRKLFHGYIALGYLYDLVWMGILLAMLLYGAFVAPRLRIIVVVAGITVLVAWQCWRLLAKPGAGQR